MSALSERRVLERRSVDADGSQSMTPSVLLACLEDVRFSLFRRMPPMLEIHRQVARAQRLVFEERILESASIDVEVRLSRVGRTSFDAKHLVRTRVDGPIVAIGVITMVSLDVHARPAAVPAALRDWVEAGDDIEALDLPHPAPADAWRHSFRARPSDENSGSHVSHTRFVDYLEDARRLCALDGGFGDDAPEAGAPCRALSISYEGEARAGDALEAHAWRAVDAGAFDSEVRRSATLAVLARARTWT